MLKIFYRGWFVRVCEGLRMVVETAVVEMKEVEMVLFRCEHEHGGEIK